MPPSFRYEWQGNHSTLWTPESGPRFIDFFRKAVTLCKDWIFHNKTLVLLRVARKLRRRIDEKDPSDQSLRLILNY
jgi:hypothetical protein